MDNNKKYYLLGKAIGVFDVDQRLTPGCINNLTKMPMKAATILRHVWVQMSRDDRIVGLLTESRWETIEIDHTQGLSCFWLGYYHAKGGDLSTDWIETQSNE